MSIIRLRLIIGLMFMVVLVFTARLYYLQIIKNDDFVARAEHQYLSKGGLFDRGSIFFEKNDGTEITAADLKTGYTIGISPKKIIDAKLIYDKLSSVINVSAEDFFLRAAKTNDVYEEISSRVEPELAEKIIDMKISGVEIAKTRWRYYPLGSSSAQVLGMIGKDNVSRGYGLEEQYDRVLNRDSKSVYSNFFAEIFSTINTTLSSEESLEGSLVTTIEPEVQRNLEIELKSINNKYSSQTTLGVIINPQNGEIYGMGTYPTFDPNDFGKSKMESFSNPVIKGRYELGSIVKALTMASGLDTGKIKSTTTYNDTGCMTLNKKTFCNYDGKKRGMIAMQEVLNQSLNVGVATITHIIGNQTLAEYFKKFGMGSTTGIDLPEEVTGNIKNLSSKNDIEYATASFGQGISLTPIQMTRALCALGNGGYLITPHLVKKINYEIGGSKSIDPGKGEQVLKTTTSEEISRMLTVVVDKALKGGKYMHEHYSIAAKTGTAQMANPNGGGYYKDRYLHSFFGYFPSYNPKYLILLVTIDPKNVNYASDTLTEPFMKLTDFILNYYQVIPDR